MERRARWDMADFFFALLLFFTAGSLVPVASAPPPRPLSCEEQLKAVKVDPAVCEKIRSAVKSVQHAVLDIDDEIVKSAKETIQEASKILGSSMSLLKEKLPMYVSRKRRALEKQKRVDEDGLSEFRALAKKAAASAVEAVKNGGKEIRDALFHTMIALHSSQDMISEATRDILRKVISKRSADEAVSEAMSKMSKEVKASMRKAVLTALGGFKDLMNNLEVQMKILFRNNKLNSGFFDDSKSQISDLADRGAKDIVDFYDESAMKSVNDAIVKVNDLLIAFRVVEKSFNKPNPKAFATVRKVVETESQAIKDTIHSEEDHPLHVESVARAMQNAADKMVSDYNDLVQIIHPNLQNEIQFW